MKNFLFICSGAIDRSPCAASLIPGSKFAGVGPLTETPVTKELIDWADKIFCMEFDHKVLLFEQFSEARKKDVEVLNVSNDFLRYDPELEKILREKLVEYL
jgi:predicted protein tyrosine phosphatase